MRSFLIYLYLEFKNSIKVLGKSVLGIFVMLVFLTLGVTAVSYGLLQSQVFQKVEVAVVIPKSEKEMKVVTRYVSNMDSVKNICEFRYMEEDVAWEELQNGSVEALISFPENFFEDVYVGKNTPARIYFKDSEDTNLLVFKELLKSGISYLQISEAGVYASLAIDRESPSLMERGQLGDYVAGLYAKEILDRERTFEKELISPFGTYDYEEYYFTAVLLILLLMSGLKFGYLYQKRRRIIGQKLKVYGVNCVQLSLIRILVMATLLWILAVAVYLTTGLVSDARGYDFLYVRPAAVFGLLLLCISVAAYLHVIYALAGGSMSGTIFILVCNLVMIISSGTLIPAAFLPEAVSRFGAVSPLAFWNLYCSNLLFGEITLSTTLPVLFPVVGIVVVGGAMGTVALWKNS